MKHLARWRGLLHLFLFCAVIGSLFDGFHTYGGATAYPHPLVLRMAFWTPLLFGAAGVAIARTHVHLDRALRRRRPPPSERATALGMLAFGGCYFLSGFLQVSGTVLLGLLLGGWTVLFLLLDRTWQGVVLAIGTALCGCSVEWALTQRLAFAHLRPDLLGLPLWLPGLYLLASLAVGNLGRALSAPDASPRPGP